MGGITKALFGGGGSKNSSGNLNYQTLTGSLMPNVTTGNNALSSIQDLLGLGGDPAKAEAGFQNYLNSTGHDFRMQEGMKAITGSNAAKGMLNSGATLKALNQYGQNIGSQDFANYLSQVGGLVTAGQNAANTVAGVGQYAQGKESQQSGIIPGLFSDRRLKRDVTKLGEYDDGLGIYRYKYLWSDEERVGFMADEVAELRPWALGAEVDGFQTIHVALV